MVAIMNHDIVIRSEFNRPHYSAPHASTHAPLCTPSCLPGFAPRQMFARCVGRLNSRAPSPSTFPRARPSSRWGLYSAQRPRGLSLQSCPLDSLLFPHLLHPAVPSAASRARGRGPPTSSPLKTFALSLSLVVRYGAVKTNEPTLLWDSKAFISTQLKGFEAQVTG